jgi:Domain of unknown function (DUF4157)
MSYSSRVYRQRNAHTTDEVKQKPFSSGQHEADKPDKQNKSVQAKLSVNEPGDSYEQEADAVAGSLINQPAQQPAVQQKKISSIQRLSTPAEDEKLGTNDARMKKDKDIQEKPLQRKGDEPATEEETAVQKKDEANKEEEQAVQKKDEATKEEEQAVQKKDETNKEEEQAVQKKEEPVKEEEQAVQKKDEANKEEEQAVQKKDEPQKEEEDKTAAAVQKKPMNTPGTVAPAVSSYLEQSAGKGNQLPAKTLKEMNAGFGVDFSKVRIHNDQEANAANQKLQAQAFTHGNDVYFNQGKFDPETAAGKFLLAHELTHVVQQNKGAMQKEVKRQPATAAKVPGIATPVPGGVQPSPKGEYETTVNGMKVTIRPDIQSRAKGKGAKTEFKQSGGEISAIKTKGGKVTSYKGPEPVVVIIQTTYQRNARPTDPSTYGRGTTAADIAAGDTTLEFHEGSHGTDYLDYLSTNALPVFGGAAGMATTEFRQHLNDYATAMRTYFTDMAAFSVSNTDCTGITIDQLTGSSVCTP